MNFATVLLLVLSFLLPITHAEPDLRTPYEKGNKNQTATYKQTMEYYKLLDETFTEVKMIEYGLTDAGKPLNLVIVSKSGDYDPETIRYKNLRIVLVNNAIHAGEPEGVDASMMLVRNLVQKKELSKYLDKLVFCVIPMYNIDGALNRGCCSRANQNGPEEYGFRGNGQNLDLNRDFVKCDSKNARSFTQLFREWQPDMFLDNHTSNGADYQYTLTYIANHPNALPQKLSNYLHKELIPAMQKSTEKDGFPMSPYVETLTDIPDSGLVGFVSPPRFSTGYASLYNTLSFTVETHMWKPFSKRVDATYSFMKHILDKVYMDSDKIAQLRKEANQSIFSSSHILNWTFDATRYDWINFKGYEAKYKPSEVSGQKRLYYDRNAPYEKKIKFYNYSKPGTEVKVPDYYIIPQTWWKVIDLLKLNAVQMTQLESDKVVKGANMYYIEGFDN
ncbi:MAG: M14 family metallopeptidase, partial [Bacteroidia bacterium]